MAGPGVGKSGCSEHRLEAGITLLECFLFLALLLSSPGPLEREVPRCKLGALFLSFFFSVLPLSSFPPRPPPLLLLFQLSLSVLPLWPCECESALDVRSPTSCPWSCCFYSSPGSTGTMVPVFTARLPTQLFLPC